MERGNDVEAGRTSSLAMGDNGSGDEGRGSGVEQSRGRGADETRLIRSDQTRSGFVTRCGAVPTSEVSEWEGVSLVQHYF